MGERHADFSSQAGNNDAEDQSCDLGRQRTGLAGRAALRNLGADGVEAAGTWGSPSCATSTITTANFRNQPWAAGCPCRQ